MEDEIRNYLKQKLLKNKKVLGCWTSLDNEITSELLALVGFDFLLIDHEHELSQPLQVIHHKY